MGTPVEPRVERRLRVFRDLAAASVALAHQVEESARDAQRRSGRFRLVLSGGSTPSTLYKLLSRRPASRFPWRTTSVFFADERGVGTRDPASNFGAVASALLSKVPVDPRNVHRIHGELRPLSAAADLYEREIDRSAIDRSPKDGPLFDLVLLGMGVDGHTASLFPRSPSLRVRRRKVVAVRRGGQPPYVPRITLTLPALASSRRICFLVGGAEKSPALALTFGSQTGGTSAVPASLVRSEGEVSWFVDRMAASRLPDRDRYRGP